MLKVRGVAGSTRSCKKYQRPNSINILSRTVKRADEGVDIVENLIISYGGVQTVYWKRNDMAAVIYCAFSNAWFPWEL